MGSDVRVAIATALLLLGGCSISALIDVDYGAECDADTVDEPAEGDGHAYDAGDAVKRVVVSPLGLITEPNKYGQYPDGALSAATNMVMRRPGILGVYPPDVAYSTDALPNGDTIRRMFATDAQTLVIGDNAGTWHVRWVTSGSAAAITSPSVFGHNFSTGTASYFKQRDRYFVATANGVIAMDSEGDTTARVSGLTIPMFALYGISAGVAVSANSSVAYRAIFTRKHSDGYEQIGPASPRFVFNNSTAGGENAAFVVALEENSNLIAGDFVELYRTGEQSVGVDPGDTYYRASTTTISSSDLTASYILINDNVPPAQLGAELYANPGQETVSKSKTPPPLARDACVHKGHTLYFATTRPAALTEFVAGDFTTNTATLASGTAARASGIGKRAFTADVTNGSAVLTNISANDMVGLAVGQRVSGVFANGAFASASLFITAVGATSVTLAGTATGSHAGDSCFSFDMMTVDGYKRLAENYISLHSSLSIPTYYASVVTFLDSTATTLVSQSDQHILEGNTSGIQFSIERAHSYEGSFTVQASNGQNYQPPIATYSASAQTVAVDQKLNRVLWSELEQPEAVPLLNSFLVGSGEIYRGVSVGGVVLVFASDGLWQIRGDGENGWDVEQLDSELFLAARGALAVMGERAYAYTNRGLVEVAPDGSVRLLSQGRIGDSGTLPGARFANTWGTYVVADEKNREILVTTNAGVTVYVWNSITDAFTTWTPSASAMAFHRNASLNTMLMGASNDVTYVAANSTTTRSFSVQYQPLTLENPSDQKEWVTVEYQFEGFSNAVETLTPYFNGTGYTARTVGQSNTKRHVTVPVPRNAPAIAPELAPGFTIASGSLNTDWTLRMMAVEVIPATPEGVSR